MKKAIKWHGGKHYLAPKIIAEMPPHLHYVEPYFGGGAVLFTRDPNKNWYEGSPNYNGLASHAGSSEIINDANSELVNFWRVIQNRDLFKIFNEEVRLHLLARATWEWSFEPCSLPTDRAVKFYIRYRMSRQGLGKDFVTPVRSRTRGGRSDPANAYWNSVEGLVEIHERLQGVIIECMDAVKFIQREDSPYSLMYLDPPYVKSTRKSSSAYGEFEMTDEEHVVLLETLASLKAKFILSGYQNEMYEEKSKLHGWRKKIIHIDNKASSLEVKEKKQECLWMNF
jgi:DNA adenine methylase